MEITPTEVEKRLSRRIINTVGAIFGVAILIAIVLFPNEYIYRAHEFLAGEFPIFYPFCMLIFFALFTRSAVSYLNKGDMPVLYTYRTLLFGLMAAFFLAAFIRGVWNAL